MKLAIITLTRKSTETGLCVKDNFEADIYTLEKFSCDRTLIIDGKLEEFNNYLFKNYDTILYIMATGIVVRSIAPYIKHKSIDPGILVMDSKGEFIIPLLSGHIGKANERAELIGKVIGAKPVITTASDVEGKISVDTIADDIGVIDDFDEATRITADILDEKKILLKSSIDITYQLPKNISSDLDSYDGVIYVSNKVINRYENSCLIVPKNIVLGIGCKRNTDFEKLHKFVLENLEKLSINPKAICKITSAYIKVDEEGLIALSKRFDVEFVTFSKSDILKVQDKFEGSDFVEKTLGVRAVAEPSGYLGSDFGKCLLSTRKKDGMTLSIYEVRK